MITLWKLKRTRESGPASICASSACFLPASARLHLEEARQGECTVLGWALPLSPGPAARGATLPQKPRSKADLHGTSCPAAAQTRGHVQTVLSYSQGGDTSYVGGAGIPIENEGTTRESVEPRRLAPTFKPYKHMGSWRVGRPLLSQDPVSN